MILKKLLTFMAGLVMGSFPPEAIAMLMEPPPGSGRLPPDVAADGMQRRMRLRPRRVRHLRPVRRKASFRRSGG